MESSRIESGADISSDGEREKTKMMQLGIQPLDIRSDLICRLVVYCPCLLAA